MLEWLDRYMAKFARQITFGVRNMLAVRKRHHRRMKKRWPCLKPSHIPVLDVHA